MKTSPIDLNDDSRDGLSLVAFTFIIAATYVVGCVALYGLFYLTNHGH